MSNKLIKKLATIVSLGIIGLSILLTIITFFSWVVSIAFDRNGGTQTIIYSNILNSFSYLISGFGFGGIIFLLGRMLKSDEE